MAKSAHGFIRYVVLIVLAAFLCVISGCSDQDRAPGNTSTQVKTAPVKFVFNLLAAKGEVPADVTRFGFFGYSDTDCKNQVYNASADKIQADEDSTQEITLDVPIEVLKVKICYYDADNTVLLESTTDKLALVEGEAQTIDVKEATQPQGATITLKFASDVTVPAVTEKCQVNLFYGNDKKAKGAYFAAINPKDLQDITIADVPTNVTKIEILWLDGNDASQSAHRVTQIPQLKVGETAEITVTGKDVIPGSTKTTSNLNLTLLNVWNNANLSTAKVHLVYKSERVTEDERDLLGALDGTTCTVTCPRLLGLNIEVMSVTLAKEEGAPFEWLDYETPQAVSKGELTLDVNDNEFANGAFVAGTTMKVANPRQFCNIDNHLDGNFEQIADVDFAGSCGIAYAVQDDEGYIQWLDNDARYSNYDKGYAPLATNAPFTGTYDGGTYTAGSEEKHFAIRGVVANSEDGDAALFAKGEGCTFKNVTMDDTCCMWLDYEALAASLVAVLSSNDNKASVFDNCTSNAKIIVGGEYVTCTEGVGGLVAQCGADSKKVNASFKKCEFGGTVQAEKSFYVGLVGYAALDAGKFVDCVNKGTISGCDHVGGIVGYLDQAGSEAVACSFTNCSNQGTVTATDINCGGIVGYADECNVAFINCSNTATATVQARMYAGGIVGATYGNTCNFTDCQSAGTVGALNGYGGSQMYYGGLAGEISSDSLKVEGTNAIDCKISGLEDASCVGGAFGSVDKYDEDELKGILNYHATVTDECAERLWVGGEASRGVYCGVPQINWLDSDVGTR